jgi:hypothetical protein
MKLRDGSDAQIEKSSSSHHPLTSEIERISKQKAMTAASRIGTPMSVPCLESNRVWRGLRSEVTVDSAVAGPFTIDHFAE